MVSLTGTFASPAREIAVTVVAASESTGGTGVEVKITGTFSLTIDAPSAVALNLPRTFVSLTINTETTVRAAATGGLGADYTYSIEAGGASNFFSIAQNGDIAIGNNTAPFSEAGEVYTITVRAESAGITDEEALTVSIILQTNSLEVIYSITETRVGPGSAAGTGILSAPSVVGGVGAIRITRTPDDEGIDVDAQGAVLVDPNERLAGHDNPSYDDTVVLTIIAQDSIGTRGTAFITVNIRGRRLTFEPRVGVIGVGDPPAVFVVANLEPFGNQVYSYGFRVLSTSAANIPFNLQTADPLAGSFRYHTSYTVPATYVLNIAAVDANDLAQPSFASSNYTVQVINKEPMSLEIDESIVSLTILSDLRRVLATLTPGGGLGAVEGGPAYEYSFGAGAPDQLSIRPNGEVFVSAIYPALAAGISQEIEIIAASGFDTATVSLTVVVAGRNVSLPLVAEIDDSELFLIAGEHRQGEIGRVRGVNGTPPYQYSVDVNGASNVRINETTGAITLRGPIATTGDYPFEVVVEDADNTQTRVSAVLVVDNLGVDVRLENSPVRVFSSPARLGRAFAGFAGRTTANTSYSYRLSLRSMGGAVAESGTFQHSRFVTDENGVLVIDPLPDSVRVTGEGNVDLITVLLPAAFAPPGLVINITTGVITRGTFIRPGLIRADVMVLVRDTADNSVVATLSAPLEIPEVAEPSVSPIITLRTNLSDSNVAQATAAVLFDDLPGREYFWTTTNPFLYSRFPNLRVNSNGEIFVETDFTEPGFGRIRMRAETADGIIREGVVVVEVRDSADIAAGLSLVVSPEELIVRTARHNGGALLAQAAAGGGKGPYTYSLEGAPPGVEIDAFGEIKQVRDTRRAVDEMNFGVVVENAAGTRATATVSYTSLPATWQVRRGRVEYVGGVVHSDFQVREGQATRNSGGRRNVQVGLGLAGHTEANDRDNVVVGIAAAGDYLPDVYPLRAYQAYLNGELQSFAIAAKKGGSSANISAEGSREAGVVLPAIETEFRSELGNSIIDREREFLHTLQRGITYITRVGAFGYQYPDGNAINKVTATIRLVGDNNDVFKVSGENINFNIRRPFVDFSNSFQTYRDDLLEIKTFAALGVTLRFENFHLGDLNNPGSENLPHLYTALETTGDGAVLSATEIGANKPLVPTIVECGGTDTNPNGERLSSGPPVISLRQRDTCNGTDAGDFAGIFAPPAEILISHNPLLVPDGSRSRSESQGTALFYRTEIHWTAADLFRGVLTADSARMLRFFGRDGIGVCNCIPLLEEQTRTITVRSEGQSGREQVIVVKSGNTPPARKINLALQPGDFPAEWGNEITLTMRLLSWEGDFETAPQMTATALITVRQRARIDDFVLSRSSAQIDTAPGIARVGSSDRTVYIAEDTVLATASLDPDEDYQYGLVNADPARGLRINIRDGDSNIYSGDLLTLQNALHGDYDNALLAAIRVGGESGVISFVGGVAEPQTITLTVGAFRKGVEVIDSAPFTLIISEPQTAVLDAVISPFHAEVQTGVDSALVAQISGVGGIAGVPYHYVFPDNSSYRPNLEVEYSTGAVRVRQAFLTEQRMNITVLVGQAIGVSPITVTTTLVVRPNSPTANTLFFENLSLSTYFTDMTATVVFPLNITPGDALGTGVRLAGPREFVITAGTAPSAGGVFVGQVYAFGGNVGKYLYSLQNAPEGVSIRVHSGEILITSAFTTPEEMEITVVASTGAGAILYRDRTDEPFGTYLPAPPTSRATAVYKLRVAAKAPFALRVAPTRLEMTNGMFPEHARVVNTYSVYVDGVRVDTAITTGILATASVIGVVNDDILFSLEGAPEGVYIGDSSGVIHKSESAVFLRTGMSVLTVLAHSGGETIRTMFTLDIRAAAALQVRVLPEQGFILAGIFPGDGVVAVATAVAEGGAGSYVYSLDAPSGYTIGSDGVISLDAAQYTGGLTSRNSSIRHALTVRVASGVGNASKTVNFGLYLQPPAQNLEILYTTGNNATATVSVSSEEINTFISPHGLRVLSHVEIGGTVQITQFAVRLPADTGLGISYRASANIAGVGGGVVASVNGRDLVLFQTYSHFGSEDRVVLDVQDDITGSRWRIRFSVSPQSVQPLVYERVQSIEYNGSNETTNNFCDLFEAFDFRDINILDKEQSRKDGRLRFRRATMQKGIRPCGGNMAPHYDLDGDGVSRPPQLGDVLWIRHRDSFISGGLIDYEDNSAAGGTLVVRIYRNQVNSPSSLQNDYYYLAEERSLNYLYSPPADLDAAPIRASTVSGDDFYIDVENDHSRENVKEEGFRIDLLDFTRDGLIDGANRDLFERTRR